MPIRERLVALDRKTIGAAYDAEIAPAARWVKVVAALSPVLAGGTAFVAFSIDRGAGVGVLIGVLATLPIALVARESARAMAGLPRGGTEASSHGPGHVAE